MLAELKALTYRAFRGVGVKFENDKTITEI